MKKGSIVRGRVERLDYPNRGIVLTDEGEFLEVKDVIPGQTIEAVVTRGREGASKGRLRAVVERSPMEQADSPCPLAGRCGGCSYQTLPYEEQLKLKEEQVRRLLLKHIPEIGEQGKGAKQEKQRTDMQADRQTDKLADKQANQQADRRAEEWIGKQAEEWAGKQEEGKNSFDTDNTARKIENIVHLTAERIENSIAEDVSGQYARIGKEETLCSDVASARKAMSEKNRGFIWEGILPSPRCRGFRNKMEFTFGDEYPGGPMTLGLHVKNSFYDIVTVDCCNIVDEDYRRIIRGTLDFFLSRNIPHYNKKTREGVLRYLIVRKAVYTGEIMVVLITSEAGSSYAPELFSCFADMLRGLPLEGSIASVWHGISDSVADTAYCENLRLLYGKASITEKALGLTFEITPYSFFQTNTLGAEVLYSKVREYVLTAQQMENKYAAMRIFDLYSGTGTIAQVLSPAAEEIIGVEIVKEAVDAARLNAERNGLDNCRFICGDVFKTLDSLPQGPDIIILDPPREGVHPKAMERISDEFAPPYIVYVSCKATSLVENLAVMMSHGYQPVKGCCVDMFPGTAHVETVCLLSKLSEAKNHISVKVDMNEMDLTAAESKATYQEIKEWVKEKYGFHVSHLNIAKTKRKCGIIERQNYNLPKSEDSRSPETPKEKEEAIIAAFKAFRMI